MKKIKIKEEYLKYAFIIFGGLLATSIITYKCENEKYLYQYGLKTTGRLIDIAGDVTYEYFVNGIKYTVHDTKTNDLEIRKGKCYEVVYDSKNPSNSDIDLDKEIPCLELEK